MFLRLWNIYQLLFYRISLLIKLVLFFMQPSHISPQKMRILCYCYSLDLICLNQLNFIRKKNLKNTDAFPFIIDNFVFICLNSCLRTLFKSYKFYEESSETILDMKLNTPISFFSYHNGVGYKQVNTFPLIIKVVYKLEKQVKKMINSKNKYTNKRS